MFKKSYTEEEVKIEAEQYLNNTFGKMFNDSISVESVIPADMFKETDYIHCYSKYMNCYFMVERGKKDDDIECDYLQVLYRENFIKPYLKKYFDGVFGDNCCLVDTGSHCRKINFDLDIDEFMYSTGVSFDILVKESDVEEKGEKFYENAIMEFVNKDLQRKWRYPVITLWVCDNLPSAEIKTMDEFDRLWSSKCKKLKYMFISTHEDLSVTNHGWK